MLNPDPERLALPAPLPAEQAPPIDLPPSLFRAFQELAYQEAGIQLRPGKEALLATRLAGRMRELGLRHPALYLRRLRADRSGAEMVRFLDCICTNLTGFYREADHFTALAAEATRRMARGERRLRVWCAAAATGEEPYSAAITLSEVFAGSEVDFRVIATDLSTAALSTAMAGRYTERQLAPVPDRLRWKYFVPHHAAAPARATPPALPVVVTPEGTSRDISGAPPHEARYQVTPRLRERVVFARLNLAVPPFPMNAPFEVIFCRNVMIYFDPPVRQRLLDELGRQLRPGGLLVVGHGETLTGLRHGLAEVRPSLFRKPLAG